MLPCGPIRNLARRSERACAERLDGFVPATREEPAPAFVAPLMLPYTDVPVLINSFNRLRSLRHLVDWLRRAGQRRIVIIDNGSSFPPLLAWLDRIERLGWCRVIRLGFNHGHLALWRKNLLAALDIRSEFVYTDPDVVPAASCPLDIVARLQRLLRDEPGIHRAGLGLDLGSIPHHYQHRNSVLAWERQFWLHPVTPTLFRAALDTTFALYRPGSCHDYALPTLRTGAASVALHEGWSIDSRSPSEEDRFYFGAADPAITSWGGPTLPPRLIEALRLRPPHPRILNITERGASPLPGYCNADLADACEAGPGQFDAIHGGSALGRTARDAGHWRALRRVAKAGARLTLRLESGGGLRRWWPATHVSHPCDRLLRGLSPVLAEGLWHLDRVVMIRRKDPRGSPCEWLLHLRAARPGAAAAAPQGYATQSRLDMAADFTGAASS